MEMSDLDKVKESLKNLGEKAVYNTEIEIGGTIYSIKNAKSIKIENDSIQNIAKKHSEEGNRENSRRYTCLIDDNNCLIIEGNKNLEIEKFVPIPE